MQQETSRTTSGKKIDRAGAAKLLRGWRGIDENHVVVQALREFYIEALRAVLQDLQGDGQRLRLTAPISKPSPIESRRSPKQSGRRPSNLSFYRCGSLTSAEYNIRRSILDALPANFNAALALRQRQSGRRAIVRANSKR